MKNVGLPGFAQRIDGIGQQADLVPFAQPDRAASSAFRTIKGQSVRGLGAGSCRAVTQPGNASDIQPGSLLGLHNGTGAEGVAAVEGKRVIENVQNARHVVAVPDRITLTGRQPDLARPYVPAAYRGTAA